MVEPKRILTYMKKLFLIVLFGWLTADNARAELRAGAAKVDVTPPVLPVIRNGGFLETTDNKVNDPLHARCLVLDDRVTRLASSHKSIGTMQLSTTTMAKRVTRSSNTRHRACS